MTRDKLFYCTECSAYYDVLANGVKCRSCQKVIPTNDGVPLFGRDIYWGKVTESELKDTIEAISRDGFDSMSESTQKKLDFTFDEDRADFRFYIPINKESTVLDLGAGLGRITIPLARVCKKVVACDQSITRMRFLKKRVESEKLTNVDIFVGDLFDLPLKKNSFDLIVMNGVFEWVGLTDLFKDPREAQIKSLEICRNLLKEGGHLYIGIENRFSLVYLKAKDHGGLRYTSYMPRFIANFYSKIRLNKEYRTYTYSKYGYEKILKKAGFEKKPRFILPYPGYNLPRTIVPYEDIYAFRYLIRAFKYPGNPIRKIIYYIFTLPFIIWFYRFFFFSFGIISKK